MGPICPLWSVFLSRRGTNTACIPLELLDRKSVGVCDLREPFLEEGAEFQIDGLGVILRRLYDPFKG
jgi:hypothetical protein